MRVPQLLDEALNVVRCRFGSSFQEASDVDVGQRGRPPRKTLPRVEYCRSGEEPTHDSIECHPVIRRRHDGECSAKRFAE
jgi:hypothetical protein